MTPHDFIVSVAGGAQDFQRKSNVFASVTIAQAALETGWGATIPVDDATGRKSYNLFGIKGEGPAGHVTCSTWEVENGQKVTIKADFRAYNSFAESIADHASVLLEDRYAPVRDAQTPQEAANQLHPCGYATDPDYGAKLCDIIAYNNLTQYDLPKYANNLSVDDANEIITRWLQHDYDKCNAEEQTRRHNLANALRVASGQPTT